MPGSDILLQWFKRNSCNLSQPSDICKRTHDLLKLYTRSRLRSVYTKRQPQRCDDAGNTFSAIVMLNFNVHTNGKDTCERTLTPTLRLRFSIFFPSYFCYKILMLISCKKLHLKKNHLSHLFQ